MTETSDAWPSLPFPEGRHPRSTPQLATRVSAQDHQQPVALASQAHRRRRGESREPMAMSRPARHHVEILDRAVDELGLRGIVAREAERRRVAAERQRRAPGDAEADAGAL